MRREGNGTPILSWVMSIRNSDPKMLEGCLKSLRDRAPRSEIVIVDNVSSNQETLAVARRFSDVMVTYRGPNGDWEPEMPWTLDMAASRTKGFSIASGRFRCWVDDDDRVVGHEEAQKLLELNGQWKPQGDKVEGDAEKPMWLEDILLEFEKAHPDIYMYHCPYLYSKDEHGNAYTWQRRERFLRWTDPPKWVWTEMAHEIMSPAEGYVPKGYITLAHVLFVHDRKFTEKENDFSTRRHFDVLHRQYAAGERTVRRCIYLTAYSRTLCPEREGEFIEAARAECATVADRYQVLLSRAQWYARQGLLMDAKEAFGAATHMRPDLPDAWILGAECWVQAEDWMLAATWLEKGLACGPGHVESQISPRLQLVRYPALLAEAYRKIAELHVRLGNHGDARAYLERAATILANLKESKVIGEEKREAKCLWVVMDNAYLAQANAIALGNLAEYLIRNDEPKKALDLLECAPWNLQDHPIVIQLERRLAPVAKHLVDSAAYQKFYETDTETGFVTSPDSWLDPVKGSLARVRWAANWLNTYAPNATVLDTGCMDGIIGVPLMLACPGIRYVGVDIYQKSIDTFRKRLDEKGLAGRAKLFRMDSISELEGEGPFDVGLWFEVIEHVPDPVAEMRRILAHLKPGGHLFVTTPWGSFDVGHPPEKTDLGTPRDSRGHVRAMTARDVAGVCEQAGVELEGLERHRMNAETLGDGLHAICANRPLRTDLVPATFAVPGALWDWHGRQVHAQGMGASEKAIVQVGEGLALDYRRVEVYGPVPEADTFRGVRYWPREQIRHVSEGKVVVSRSPGYWAHLDDVTRKPLAKILWLQDAYYPDLSKQVAERYEKVVVVSEWHKQAMHEVHGVPLDKMEVIYNPVDPRLYADLGKVERKRDRFVYCSSPDRALIPLLRLWPRIRERLPGAELEVFYGWKGCQKLGLGTDARWTQRYETARREFERLRYQPGVTIRDMVPPTELARTFLSAGVWAYPVETFAETGCASACEARAAGCVPVCPPLAALAETAKCPQGFFTPLATDHPASIGASISYDLSKPSPATLVGGWTDAFVEACVAATKVSDADRAMMSQDAIRDYSIEAVLPQWKALLEAK